MTASITDMYEHDGEYFQRWRVAMARSVGGLLLDELEQPGDS